VLLVVAGLVAALYYSGRSDGQQAVEPAAVNREVAIERPARDEEPVVFEAAVEPVREEEPVVKEEPESVVEEPVVEEIVVQQSVPDLAEIVSGTAAAPDSKVGGLVAEAMALMDANPPRYIEARDRLNELLPMASGQQRAFIKKQLSELSEDWLFSRMVFPNDKLCEFYKVQPGDLLVNIGRKFNVPYEILMELNQIRRPEELQAGQTIKVMHGPFHAKVYRSTFTMDLYLQNTYVRSFKVGLGKAGSETPTGRWKVAAGGKLISPTWTDPNGRTYEADDPDYPLGSRWIGLDGVSGEAQGREGFAIHGTKEPEQIGRQGSLGCIRLFNGDAILVYNLMMPGMSLVDVVD
jgi:hypothetical protein